MRASISGTRLMPPRQCPSEFHILHTCSVVPSLCYDPCVCRAPGILQNRKFHTFHTCSAVPSFCYDSFAHARCVCRAPGIHQNREFHVSHAFATTPWICEFHIYRARLMVHARLCYDPSDPCLLSAFYGAHGLLQPIRSMSAACP